MKNRETTYYSLLSSHNLRLIEQTADNMSPETFVMFKFDEKWYGHLWIPENNECFLEKVSYFEDLQKLDAFLSEQLKLYVRKIETYLFQDEGYSYTLYKARKDWLKHTIFICRNEHKKTKKEIFKEVIKWCKDWQKNWVETFNPDTTTHETVNQEPMQSNQKLSNEEMLTCRQVENIAYNFNDRFPKLFVSAQKIKDDFVRIEKYELILTEADKLIYEYAKLEQLQLMAGNPPEIINSKDLNGEIVSTPNYLKKKEKEFEILEDYKFKLSQYGTAYSDLYEELKFLHPEKMAGKEEFLSTIVKVEDPKIEKKISLIQIALFYIYNDESINNENKNDIARRFGHNSGHKLIQFYNKLILSTDRKGDPGSSRKMKHKIRMFEDVVPMLSGDSKKRAEKDLQHLNNLYNEHYQ